MSKHDATGDTLTHKKKRKLKKLNQAGENKPKFKKAKLARVDDPLDIFNDAPKKKNKSKFEDDDEPRGQPRAGVGKQIGKNKRTKFDAKHDDEQNTDQPKADKPHTATASTSSKKKNKTNPKRDPAPVEKLDNVSLIAPNVT